MWNATNLKKCKRHWGKCNLTKEQVHTPKIGQNRAEQNITLVLCFVDYCYKECEEMCLTWKH
jgi:hypothetical protein